MEQDLTNNLMKQLNDGDRDAVDLLFRTYTPYLRAIVRRLQSQHLQSQFDSIDVVQSVWVQVVRQLTGDGWKIENEDQLRGLLATIARRRLFTRVRRHDLPAMGTSENVTVDPPDPNPRPSEMAQAKDLWEFMLQRCPPEHREVLTLRRQGLRLSDIAQQTGLHEGSVRRILRRLAREMATFNPLSADEWNEELSNG